MLFLTETQEVVADITDTRILLIALVLYIIGLFIAIKYDKFYLTFIALLWLIPVYIVDDNIIKLFSVIMLIVHVAIPLTDKIGGDDFE